MFLIASHHFKEWSFCTFLQMKSHSFGCTVSEIIAASISTWEEGQPASANRVVAGLVAMANSVSSPVLMLWGRKTNEEI